jgi:hypothetical protein
LKPKKKPFNEASYKKLHSVLAFYFVGGIVLMTLVSGQVQAQSFGDPRQHSGDQNRSGNVFDNDTLSSQNPQAWDDNDSLNTQDSLNNNVETYSKRNFVHTEQVITASAFMAAIAFLMASMNNFNPKR